jgi:demethoxyubiquinone hydroxylase (CLK1/Coq7/Cat5 family)
VFAPSVPDAQNVSQAASTISHNFTTSNTQTVIEKHYYEPTNPTQNNDEMLTVMNKLNNFLEDNKTLQAVISRKEQIKIENFEAFLKKRAKI